MLKKDDSAAGLAREEIRIKEITVVLKRNDNILFAILFGSYLTGRSTLQSDIDLGLFFRKSPDFFFLEELKDEIFRIKKKRVDIVNLNRAAPVISMQVLKTGLLLFGKQSREYNEFFVKTVITYDDLKRTREIVEESILKGRIYAGS